MDQFSIQKCNSLHSLKGADRTARIDICLIWISDIAVTKCCPIRNAAPYYRLLPIADSAMNPRVGTATDPEFILMNNGINKDKDLGGK